MSSDKGNAGVTERKVVRYFESTIREKLSADIPCIHISATYNVRSSYLEKAPR